LTHCAWTIGQPRVTSPAASAVLIKATLRRRATRRRTTTPWAERSIISIATTRFIDSITAASRLSYRWSEQQPEAFSERTGKKDTRGAYGLHAREMIAWLNQLQHARALNLIFVGILEKVVDDFNVATWQLQMEGGKTSRELPGIVDEIIAMQLIDFGDGNPVRVLVCTSPNPWGFPAKDRAGRLEQIEEPHLGKLIAKLVGGDRKPFIASTTKATAHTGKEQQNGL
jgi:hypothetical protein